jgi:hypothetical protein
MKMNRLIVLWGTLVASLLLTGCDQAFLHEVESRKSPTDTSGCTPPNGGPQSLSAKVFADRVELSWESDATDADGFLIERKSSADGIWGELIQLAPDADSFTDREVGPDMNYIYRVTAYRLVDNERCSSPSVPEIEALTFPKPIEQLSAQTRSSQSIALSWTNPNSLGTSRCRVERRTDPEEFAELTTTEPSVLVFVDEELAAGTT